MKTFLKICVKLWNSFWTLILNLATVMLLGKGVEAVAVVYATLIVKGVKTFADVPVMLKEQVKEILIALDCAELTE